MKCGYSAGTMEILAECGVYLFGFYMIGIIRLLIYEYINKKYDACLMVILVILISFTTSVPYSAIIWLFSIYGYNIKGIK